MIIARPPPVADLATLALAALGHHALGAGQREPGWSSDMLPACLAAVRTTPAPHDRRLVVLADALGLTDTEVLGVALCLAAETDPAVARALAEAQAPIGGSRPLAGLLATVLAPLGATVAGLACGAAVGCGLLRLGEEPAALAERSLSLPLHMVGVLTGHVGAWDRVCPLPPASLAIPHAIRAEARARAGAVGAVPRAGLVLRCAAAGEALAVAHEVASALGCSLARIEGEPPRGLAPWLIAAEAVPVFMPHPGPGERWACPDLGPYTRPWIVAPGIDGAIDGDPQGPPPDDWTLPVPRPEERALLWRQAGLSAVESAKAAENFRQGAGRIAEAAARARIAAARAGRAVPDWRDVTEGVARGAATLDALARRGVGEVTDDALVLPAGLRDSLERLLLRARVRERLAQGLGPALAARYRPGLRALLVGESGTGKTLAAHWLATRLGLPLYRVDLAAMTSKWIGETEKNLSAILAAAEHADVLLFFDEADALFAARTDVGDANDRFANAQTNYLLQRIEEFDGIALLASNSRDRFDPAFVRRLDAILEFPMPEAPARRALWCAHLGDAHALDDAALDRLAVSVDLAGGHIRNVVLAAAARAVAGTRPIGWEDIAQAARDEYAKLGRPAPELSR
jgi:ATPase family protein associated with various cellular activities (AAA)